MKCEKCGSENIIEGSLAERMGMVCFSQEKVRTKGLLGLYTQMSAWGCKDCGHVFDLKMVNNKFK